MAASDIKVPNGYSVNTLNQGLISTLGMLKPDNYGEFVKISPDLFRDYFIMSLEAEGNVRESSNNFFDQWIDDNKPFPSFRPVASVSGSAGATIVVTLTADSHIGGSLSPVAVDSLYVDAATNIEYIAVASNKSVSGAHTASLKPTLSTDVPAVTTNSILQWVGRGPAVEASDVADGIYRGLQKRRRTLSTIRTDKKWTDRASMETTDFNGMTLVDLDKERISKDHQFATEYKLMRGKIRNNIASATVENNTDEGLIKQIERFGTNSGNSVTLSDAYFKQVSRIATGNGYIKNFTMLGENTVSFAIDDYLSTKLGFQGAVNYGDYAGKSELDVAFNYGAFTLYNAAFKYKEYKLFNSAYTHGGDPEYAYADTGRFLLIPDGTVIHPDQTSSKMVTVRYQAYKGMMNHIATDGSFFDKNVKHEGIVSITSTKGLETYNIDAFFSGKIA
jgi:hypothetical protein